MSDDHHVVVVHDENVPRRSIRQKNNQAIDESLFQLADGENAATRRRSTRIKNRSALADMPLQSLSAMNNGNGNVMNGVGNKQRKEETIGRRNSGGAAKRSVASRTAAANAVAVRKNGRFNAAQAARRQKHAKKSTGSTPAAMQIDDGRATPHLTTTAVQPLASATGSVTANALIIDESAYDDEEDDEELVFDDDNDENDDAPLRRREPNDPVKTPQARRNAAAVVVVDDDDDVEAATTTTTPVADSTTAATGPVGPAPLVAAHGTNEAPVDIDLFYRGSLRHCSEYARDVYQHLREKEHHFRPVSDDIWGTVQLDITPLMREVLMDWLVEVADEYQLCPETLFLTKNYIDRYLACRSVSRSRLQLLGISCMLIASKYEELQPPTVQDMIVITDNSYHHDELVEFEIEVLDVLDFELAAPTEKTFLKRFLMAAAAHITCTRTFSYAVLLANYIIERSIQSADFLPYPPSMLAAAGTCLSLYTLGLRHWSPTLAHYTNIDARNQCFRGLVNKLYALHALSHNAATQPNATLCAVAEKYSRDTYLNIAKLPPARSPPFTLNRR
jgi:Cyclin, N-terminal domain/Cyclin, C-terminal domain